MIAPLLLLPLWFLVATAALQDAKEVEVEIELQGNDSISSRQLNKFAVDAFNSVKNRSGRRADVDDAAFLLETFYREQGFPQAVVSWQIFQRQQETVVLYEIAEGPQILLAEIQFTGNTVFDHKALAALLPSPRSGFLDRGKPWFVESDVNGLPASIRRALIVEGYLKATVTPPQIRVDEESRRAFVEITIHEGPQYVIGSVSYQGQEEVPLKELRSTCADLIGTPAAPRKRIQLRARVLNFYHNHGFPEAVVNVHKLPAGDDLAIPYEVTIKEGPRVTVGSIRIIGNDETRDKFVLNRMTLKEGEIFREEAERASFRRLFATGLFDSVNLSLQGEGTHQDLVVELSERPSFEVFTAAGYGSYEKLRAEAGFKEKNLFGTGRSLKLEVGASTVGESAELSLTDPWLLGSNLRLDVPFEYLRREEPSFSRLEFGTGVALRADLPHDFTTVLSYHLRQSENFDVETATEELEADVRIGSLRLQVSHDTRDAPFHPSRGHFVSTRVEYGDEFLGGELEFVRAEATAVQFFSLSEKVVLGLRAETGVIEPIGDTDSIPIQERFFNGGQSSVRSFAESELGPQSNGEPIGGEVANTLSAELRARIVGPFQASVFYDYGNVAVDNDDYFDDFRSAIGVGAQYLLPVGAIRVDIGWNPSRKSGEDTYRAHLSIGMAF